MPRGVFPNNAETGKLRYERQFVITQAKVRLYIPCPSCTEGHWRADQLRIGTETKWSCETCHKYARVTRLSEFEWETIPNGQKETPVVVTLQSVTEPKITLKLNAWKYAHSQNDTQEEYESHQRYFYNEHTCPTNWTSQIVEIIFQGDHDPHGVFEFVSVEDGHLVDDEYCGPMVLKK